MSPSSRRINDYLFSIHLIVHYKIKRMCSTKYIDDTIRFYKEVQPIHELVTKIDNIQL